MFYVYILQSLVADKFYVGQTNDVDDRLKRHNAGLENFTSKYRSWILLGFIEKGTRAEAAAKSSLEAVIGCFFSVFYYYSLINLLHCWVVISNKLPRLLIARLLYSAGVLFWDRHQFFHL